MSDEVSREIREILDKGQPEKDSEGDGGAVNITVGDIVNNQGTVVIGGNVNQGRREEDQEGSGDTGHGRRASDRALRQELRSLRQQVRNLKQLVTSLYGWRSVNTFKRPASRVSACPILHGTKPASRHAVPNYPTSRHAVRPARPTARQPAPRRTSRPAISSPLPPNPTSPYVSYSLSPLNEP